MYDQLCERSTIKNKYQELLEKLKDRINSTKREYIKIKAKKDMELKLWQSKFFGKPYLLKDQKYPTDDNGNNLYLLAQLNLSQMPNLEFSYPKKGLLQFWISDKQLYGLDFKNRTKQNGFKVIFHKEVQEDNNKLVQDFSFLSKIQKEKGWICEDQDQFAQFALDFKIDKMPITSCDNYFYELFADILEDKDIDKFEFMDAYDNAYNKEYMKHNKSNPNHVIGGYPYFTQEDPRKLGKEYLDFNILLFQMDSDITNKIMWGDCGVANFFINQKDLEALDFSRVFYNWDCS